MELAKEIALLLKASCGKEVKEASVRQLYDATAKAILLHVEEDWQKTKNADQKRCGYLSAEFLIGRLIYANLLNLNLMQQVKEALASFDVDINVFEEIEDAALGNGGLGRLAACFLESAATSGLPLDGYGLRYRFGLFKQTFVNGFQNEEADDWLKWGDPFSRRVLEDAQIVHFADMDVRAVPYDMPVIGYDSKTVNTLRLWQSEPIESFDFALFDQMEGQLTALNNYKATEITAVLYPNDNTQKGKTLRLRQEYFMVSASIQDVMKKFRQKGLPWDTFPDYFIFQLNDTHPTLAIPELMRLLKQEGLSFEEAFEICHRSFNFTNHTILAEALEKWPVAQLKELIPDVYEQIEQLQHHLEQNEFSVAIIKDNLVHMADLAIAVCRHVNGVAQIHTNILKEETFKDWYAICPEKFVNVTNGVTPRRWLALNNPLLALEITNRIGNGWINDLSQLHLMKPYVDDPVFLKRFRQIRLENKKRLQETILKQEGIFLPTEFLYDIQIKRLHEYKRQLLNALGILYLYNEIKSGNLPDFKPTAFIFGAKSAPGYYMAKAIIKLINTIAHKVNGDPLVGDKLRVVFVSNYNVSYAEKLVCAADLSEQISMAGMEASGTGNMKFMINGTPTIGTLDGANVEITEEAGIENNYIFGLTVEEVEQVKQHYVPSAVLDEQPKLKKVVESLIDGTLSDDGSGMFQAIYQHLLQTDYYLVLADFKSYIETKLKANAEYDTSVYYRKCVVNMQASGKFSSDRSVLDYNALVWHLK